MIVSRAGSGLNTAGSGLDWALYVLPAPAYSGLKNLQNTPGLECAWAFIK
jgi:hypothetical protein